MALISCPECGNMLSDKAKSCPHCGYDQSELVTEYVWCPSCMSNHIQCRRKGVNIGRAVIGTVVGGSIIGLMGATDDMNDMVYVCERCSMQFKFNECFKGRKQEAENFEQKFVELVMNEKMSDNTIQFVMDACHCTKSQARRIYNNYTMYNRKKFEVPNEKVDLIIGIVAVCIILAVVIACMMV